MACSLSIELFYIIFFSWGDILLGEAVVQRSKKLGIVLVQDLAAGTELVAPSYGGREREGRTSRLPNICGNSVRVRMALSRRGLMKFYKTRFFGGGMKDEGKGKCPAHNTHLGHYFKIVDVALLCFPYFTNHPFSLGEFGAEHVQSGGRRLLLYN